jgi:hypothetical protein
VNLHHRMFLAERPLAVLSCAARSVADGGRRPTIRVLGLILILTLGFALLD